MGCGSSVQSKNESKEPIATGKLASVVPVSSPDAKKAPTQTVSSDYQYIAPVDNSDNIFAAIKRGDVNEVKRIIDKHKMGATNSSVNRLVGMWNATPLIVAIQYSQTEIVQLLLNETDLGDINHLNDKGASALLYSCMEGNTAATTHLLKNNAKISIVPTTDPVYNAASDSSLRCTAFSIAIMNGHQSTVALLLDAQKSMGGSPQKDKTDKTVDHPFSFPTAKSIFKPVKFGAGASAKSTASVTGGTPGGAGAAGSGRTTPTNPSNSQQGALLLTPCLLAAASGRVNVLRELLWRGCDVSIADAENSTLLHHIARAKQDQRLMFEELKKNDRFPECDALLNAFDLNGDTPLLVACEHCPNCGSGGGSAGNSPTLTPHAEQYLDYVKLLLEEGCSLAGKSGANSDTGITPLHIAIRKRNVVLVKILLEYGADPLQGDKEKVSSHDLALKLNPENEVYIEVNNAATAWMALRGISKPVPSNGTGGAESPVKGVTSAFHSPATAAPLGSHLKDTHAHAHTASGGPSVHPSPVRGGGAATATHSAHNSAGPGSPQPGGASPVPTAVSGTKKGAGTAAGSATASRNPSPTKSPVKAAQSPSGRPRAFSSDQPRGVGGDDEVEAFQQTSSPSPTHRKTTGGGAASKTATTGGTAAVSRSKDSGPAIPVRGLKKVPSTTSSSTSAATGKQSSTNVRTSGEKTNTATSKQTTKQAPGGGKSTLVRKGSSSNTSKSKHTPQHSSANDVTMMVDLETSMEEKSNIEDGSPLKLSLESNAPHILSPLSEIEEMNSSLRGIKKLNSPRKSPNRVRSNGGSPVMSRTGDSGSVEKLEVMDFEIEKVEEQEETVRESTLNNATAASLRHAYTSKAAASNSNSVSSLSAPAPALTGSAAVAKASSVYRSSFIGGGPLLLAPQGSFRGSISGVSSKSSKSFKGATAVPATAKESSAAAAPTNRPESSDDSNSIPAPAVTSPQLIPTAPSLGDKPSTTGSSAARKSMITSRTSTSEANALIAGHARLGMYGSSSPPPVQQNKKSPSKSRLSGDTGAGTSAGSAAVLPATASTSSATTAAVTETTTAVEGGAAVAQQPSEETKSSNSGEEGEAPVDLLQVEEVKEDHSGSSATSSFTYSTPMAKRWRPADSEAGGGGEDNKHDNGGAVILMVPNTIASVGKTNTALFASTPSAGAITKEATTAPTGAPPPLESQTAIKPARPAPPAAQAKQGSSNTIRAQRFQQKK